MSNGKLIHKGNLIELHEEPVQLRDGGQTYFDIVKHPGGAVIVAINDKDEVCLLKQYRHAVREHIWELPAGCLEPNEPPLETAKRELTEETGWTAGKIQPLFDYFVSPGILDEKMYAFVATELVEGNQNLMADEEITTLSASLEEALDWVRDGKILDAKTIATLLYYDRFR